MDVFQEKNSTNINGCFSREKLFISEKLKVNWNNSDFILLGLQFSTNLNFIPEMNYSKAIESTKAFLGNGKIDA